VTGQHGGSFSGFGVERHRSRVARLYAFDRRADGGSRRPLQPPADIRI
jgi:hypothetical protein